ncbi:MAG: histidine phosphatase family protein [Firmicutes bacterium]|nr:histidine phosphatase family protein [Bacillota bacterium]
MKTTIYLIRHSEPFKVHRGNVNVSESILIENEKSPLSINGEKIAEKWATNVEFNALDVVYSSNYVRAMSTAKYFAHNNNLKVNIDERFNERIHGVDSWEELPKNFESNQFEDENYKVGFGESQKDVQTRMYSALVEVMKNYKGKRIAIISHSTAIAFLLKMFSDVQYTGDYSYKENKYFDGKWDYVETFKLEFDENNVLVNIANINE